MSHVICHCFGYSAVDIEQEWAEHGRSILLERIAATLKGGESQCGQRHPQGR